MYFGTNLVGNLDWAVMCKHAAAVLYGVATPRSPAGRASPATASGTRELARGPPRPFGRSSPVDPAPRGPSRCPPAPAPALRRPRPGLPRRPPLSRRNTPGVLAPSAPAESSARPDPHCLGTYAPTKPAAIAGIFGRSLLASPALAYTRRALRANVALPPPRTAAQRSHPMAITMTAASASSTRSTFLPYHVGR